MTKPDKIADAEEVLAYLTACMRGDAGDSARIKAAELLAKRYGLLTERAAATAEVPRIIDDIARAGDEDGTGGAPDA